MPRAHLKVEKATCLPTACARGVKTTIWSSLAAPLTALATPDSTIAVTAACTMASVTGPAARASTAAGTARC